MAFACRKLKQFCVGREVVLHTDHIAWSELNVNKSNERMLGYLMDIMEVSPTGVYVREIGRAHV